MIHFCRVTQAGTPRKLDRSHALLMHSRQQAHGTTRRRRRLCKAENKILNGRIGEQVLNPQNMTHVMAQVGRLPSVVDKWKERLGNFSRNGVHDLAAGRHILHLIIVVVIMDIIGCAKRAWRQQGRRRRPCMTNKNRV